VTWWRGRSASGAPTQFTSQRTGEARRVRIKTRHGISTAQRDALATSLAEIDWADLHHAYGRATEVPALLYAVMFATDDVRREAWWELWGNVHHQGTVYEATPASVPFLARIASDATHPERVNALAFLRAVALGNGTYAPATRAAVEAHLPGLLPRWQSEPELVQRALLYLASAYPNQIAELPALVRILPDEHRTAWTELLAAGGDPATLLADDDEHEGWEVQDRQYDLEVWALAGWHEPSSPARSS
jgi:hypothetical protein